MLILLLCLQLAVGVLWLIALVDLAGRTDLQPKQKTVWVIVVALLNIFGAFLYWILCPRPNEDALIEEMKEYQ